MSDMRARRSLSPGNFFSTACRKTLCNVDPMHVSVHQTPRVNRIYSHVLIPQNRTNSPNVSSESAHDAQTAHNIIDDLHMPICALFVSPAHPQPQKKVLLTGEASAP